MYAFETSGARSAAPAFAEIRRRVFRTNGRLPYWSLSSYIHSLGGSVWSGSVEKCSVKWVYGVLRAHSSRRCNVMVFSRVEGNLFARWSLFHRVCVCVLVSSFPPSSVAYITRTYARPPDRQTRYS